MCWHLLILLSVLAFGFAACDEDDPKIEELHPSIHAVSTPGFLLCDSDSIYVFEIRVEDAPDVTSILCTIDRPAGDLTFELYDDGGATELTPHDFASLTSLDVVPNNGTFTRGIRADLFCGFGEGTYPFLFTAQGSAAQLILNNVTVEVRSLEECVFEDIPLVTSLPACFEPQTHIYTVVQPQGIAIDTVRATWKLGDDVWWEKDLTRGDATQWTLLLEPSLFGLTPSGFAYSLHLDAYTSFGYTCGLGYAALSFENLPAVLSNPDMPDTMFRPVAAGDSNIYQMYVQYDDCELLGWSQYETVWFQVRREDVPEWPPPGEFFFLRNDGVPPDLHAGDNIASSFLKTENNGRVNDLYYFRFFAADPASGDTSNFLIDSTRIIQSGPLSVTLPPSDELGVTAPK